jgi:glycosyltransferase involved in cell wall biosynthesis
MTSNFILNSDTSSIALNARFYSHAPTGMQRYGIEMANRLDDLLKVLKPASPLKGAKGHLWEQMYLPTAAGKRLLWSPNNTGPLAVAHQVCTIHDIIPIEHPEWFSSEFSGWYQWLMPKLVDRVQHIIAVSHFTKQRLVERFAIKPEKVSVVWNGVDASFRPRPLREIEHTKKEAGIQSPRYVLSLGSLEPRKNLKRLLTAWERILPELPEDVELVVAGAKGASKVFAESKIDRIPGRVNFTGYIPQDHLPALYSGATALVYPSLYEGFGLPPLEAMACGCPVVTSNCTSLPEVVGDDAILVDPFDEESIAEGLFRIIVRPHLREQLSRRAFNRVEPMSWEASAAKTRAILLEQSHA